MPEQKKENKYQNFKLPVKTLKSIVTILEESGIKIRNSTEAVNMILSNFIIQKNIMLPLLKKEKELSSGENRERV